MTNAAAAALLLGLSFGNVAQACDRLPAPGDQVLAGSVAVGGGLKVYYAQPTTRYAHGVLGDAVEAGELVVDNTVSPNPCGDRIVLPRDRVFEDVAPRLVDLDGDDYPEIIVVESQQNQGAQLAVYGYVPGVYDRLVKRAATPHIGTRNRWLAPIGAGADLDGDGYVELAYIDRPHLAKTLRVWRFKDGALEPVADLAGLTNHRIGEEDIGGGIRDCGQGPEMITASANWRNVMATRLRNGQLSTRAIGPHRGRASLNAALACR